MSTMFKMIVSDYSVSECGNIVTVHFIDGRKSIALPLGIIKAVVEDPEYPGLVDMSISCVGPDGELHTATQYIPFDTYMEQEFQYEAVEVLNSLVIRLQLVAL